MPLNIKRDLMQRIVLRSWQEEDFARYRRWHDGHFPWMDFNGPYYAQATLQEIDARIEKWREASADDQSSLPLSAMVIADRKTNVLLGTVSSYWQSQETNWLSLGLALYDESTWGKGLGYEALGLWSQLILDSKPELVRLDLRTWSGNIGMMKLAERLGYTLEARFRKARIVKGEYYDSLGYGVMREEWQVRYPRGFADTI